MINARTFDLEQHDTIHLCLQLLPKPSPKDAHFLQVSCSCSSSSDVVLRYTIRYDDIIIIIIIIIIIY